MGGNGSVDGGLAARGEGRPAADGEVRAGCVKVLRRGRRGRAFVRTEEGETAVERGAETKVTPQTRRGCWMRGTGRRHRGTAREGEKERDGCFEGTKERCRPLATCDERQCSSECKLYKCVMSLLRRAVL